MRVEAVKTWSMGGVGSPSIVTSACVEGAAVRSCFVAYVQIETFGSIMVETFGLIMTRARK